MRLPGPKPLGKGCGGASIGIGLWRGLELAGIVGYSVGQDPTRCLSCELPQGGNAARVSELWQVRGVPLFLPGAVRLAGRRGEF